MIFDRNNGSEFRITIYIYIFLMNPTYGTLPGMVLKRLLHRIEVGCDFEIGKNIFSSLKFFSDIHSV